MKNLIFYISVILIWGSTWLAIKFQLGVVDPMVSIIYRFAGAALFIFGYCILSKKSLRFPLKAHLFMMMQGITTFAINYWLFYTAQQVITSGLAAVLFSLLVFMNILNSGFFLKTRIQFNVILGAFLGLIGIVFLFQPEFVRLDLSFKTLLMIAFGLTGTYIFSLGNIISARNQRENIPVVQSTAFSMLYGVLFLFLLAMICHKEFILDLSFQYLGALFYAMIFGSVIAFLCYLTLIGQIGAGKTAYVTLLTPIVAMTLSTFFEGYHWSILAIIGMVLILSGNLVALMKRSIPVESH